MSMCVNIGGSERKGNPKWKKQGDVTAIYHFGRKVRLDCAVVAPHPFPDQKLRNCRQWAIMVQTGSFIGRHPAMNSPGTGWSIIRQISCRVQKKDRCMSSYCTDQVCQSCVCPSVIWCSIPLMTSSSPCSWHFAADLSHCLIQHTFSSMCVLADCQLLDH